MGTLIALIDRYLHVYVRVLSKCGARIDKVAPGVYGMYGECLS